MRFRREGLDAGGMRKRERERERETKARSV